MIRCGGRNGFNSFNWTQEGLDIYLNNSFNLIPFKTIIEYIQKIFTSLLDTSTIFLNLFGNIACLMPLALFIPMLFKKIDTTKKFLISILCVTLAIEIIQFITFSGSCDIDDIILNIADLMATSYIITSPYERIKDISKRKTADFGKFTTLSVVVTFANT